MQCIRKLTTCQSRCYFLSLQMEKRMRHIFRPPYSIQTIITCTANVLLGVADIAENVKNGNTPDPIRPMRWGPDPNRPTRRAINDDH